MINNFMILDPDANISDHLPIFVTVTQIIAIKTGVVSHVTHFKF